MYHVEQSCLDGHFIVVGFFVEVGFLKAGSAPVLGCYNRRKLICIFAETLRGLTFSRIPLKSHD